MKRAVFAALALACAVSASPAAAQGACNRDLLQGIAGDWIEGIEKGTAFTMNLGEWVEYRENLERGFMSVFFDKPRKVDWHRALLDTTSCKVMIESVVLEGDRPMVLATQLTNGFFGVTPLDNLVTDAGDWQFDAPASRAALGREEWSEVAEGQRGTVAELTAVADAYLDRLGDAAVEVALADGCTRLDGGAPVGTCQDGLPDGLAVTERQYLVDPVLGGVNVLARVGANGRPASFTFRIDQGRIRSVHTLVNCGDEANCRL